LESVTEEMRTGKSSTSPKPSTSGQRSGGALDGSRRGGTAGWAPGPILRGTPGILAGLGESIWICSTTVPKGKTAPRPRFTETTSPFPQEASDGPLPQPDTENQARSGNTQEAPGVQGDLPDGAGEDR